MNKILFFILIIVGIFSSCTKTSSEKKTPHDENTINVIHTKELVNNVQTQTIFDTPVLKTNQDDISSAMRFFSMSFNAKSYSDADSDGDTSYYFYGYEDYSEAFIYTNSIRLSTGEPESFYPNGLISYMFPPYKYHRYSGENNTIGYRWPIPTIGDMGEEHKFENNRLVYYTLISTDNEPYGGSERIEQNDQEIIIYINDPRGNYQLKFHNISNTELLEIFLKKYIKIICETNEFVKNYDNIDDAYEHIVPLIQGRTARELAIFKNCLFAIKGCRFENSEWTDFFKKYLDGYNGQYTNDEVLAMFTDSERGLLDLIVQ